MIPFTATYKKTTISFEIPQSYEEITLGQYIDRLKWDGEDLLNLVGTMTGLKDEVIRNTDHENVMEQIVSRLGWLSTPPAFFKTIPDDGTDKKSKETGVELPVPDKIRIGDYTDYLVPKDIRAETFGQKISLQVHLKMSQKDKLSLIETIPYALAIYFQPIMENRSYDEERAIRLIPKMLEINLLDAYSVGCFFLHNSRRLSKRRFSRFLTNRMAGLRLLMSTNSNRSASTGPLTDSPGETSSSMTKSFFIRIGMSS